VTLSDAGFLDVGAQHLEYRMIGPRPDAAPTLVLLHEGLGCVGLWGDFPERLAAATGAGVFAYSRAGFGRSSAVTLPRPLSFMHDEARDVLPPLLAAIGFRRGLLIGHSDGASIAAIYAGSVQDHRVRGLVLMAPHLFTEDATVNGVAQAREAYAQGDLRARLARWHSHVDCAFRTWSESWSNPAFRSWNIREELAYIRVPILIIQGAGDQYGTVRQIETAQEECYCPVEVALLAEAGHAPHREAAEVTLDLVAGFVIRLLRDHHEGDLAAHAA
jgi:pimeloyl-ACP methyl ester carboxylesterase